MTSAQAFFQGFFIMVVFCVIGAALSFASGMAVDQMHDSFVNIGAFEYTNPDWDTASGTMNALINLHYFWWWIFPLLGVAIFIITIVKSYLQDRQRQAMLYRDW